VPRQTRTEASERHRVRIENRPFRVIDTPGQAFHGSDRLRSIREVASRPPIRVINVVSFGFHEYGTSASKAVDTHLRRPRVEFLEQHRKEELRALLEWLPLLGDRDTTKWILTVVAKADLWWNDSDTVLDHYRTGAYNDAISAADSKIKRAVMPYCAVAHKFFDIVPLANRFDDTDRITMNIHFLQQLIALG
jgi:hypothetical protein